MWSAHDQSSRDLPRTQNEVEAWHRRFELLVGEVHMDVYRLVRELQKEVNKRTEGVIRGENQPPKRKEYVIRNQRITNIINDRENRTVIQFLRVISHNMSF